MKEGKYRLEFCVGKYVLMPVDVRTFSTLVRNLAKKKNTKNS